MSARLGSWRMSFVLLVSLVMHVSCKDHAYRHEIEGRVVDGAGVPIPQAIVTRINDKGEPYGLPDMYQAKVDDKGHFRFVNEGRGPVPLKAIPWRLAVEVPSRKDRAHFDVQATWSDDRATCFGYCARDLTLVVR
mgnify:CR=1 FL=1